MNLINPDDVDNLIKALDYCKEIPEIPAMQADEQSQNYFKYVHFFESEKANIIQLNPELSIDTLLYSEYYWFIKYKDNIERYGDDEGLEQQAYKMLERINIALNGKIDWSIIEQIEKTKESR